MLPLEYLQGLDRVTLSEHMQEYSLDSSSLIQLVNGPRDSRGLFD